MGKLVIDDTYHKDQNAKRPLHTLIDTVSHQFMATDKHQQLFVCVMHGSLCIDKISYFFFTRIRLVHRTRSCLVHYGYFQATKLTVFSIQLVQFRPKDIFLHRGSGAVSSTRWIRCLYTDRLSC